MEAKLHKKDLDSTEFTKMEMFMKFGRDASLFIH